MPDASPTASPLVFIVHHDGHFDISDVMRYGKPVHVFRRDVFPDEIDGVIDRLMKRAAEVLREFDPNKDYLCLVGSPLFMAICGYTLGVLGKKPVRVLRYDRIEKAYYEVTCQPTP